MNINKYLTKEQVIEDIIKNKKEQYCLNCEYCLNTYNSFVPKHFASSQCESGKRNHCTCDICF